MLSAKATSPNLSPILAVTEILTSPKVVPVFSRSFCSGPPRLAQANIFLNSQVVVVASPLCLGEIELGWEDAKLDGARSRAGDQCWELWHSWRGELEAEVRRKLEGEKECQAAFSPTSLF